MPFAAGARVRVSRDKRDNTSSLTAPSLCGRRTGADSEVQVEPAETIQTSRTRPRGVADTSAATSRTSGFSRTPETQANGGQRFCRLMSKRTAQSHNYQNRKDMTSVHCSLHCLFERNKHTGVIRKSTKSLQWRVYLFFYK